jgi:signal peptidase I
MGGGGGVNNREPLGPEFFPKRDRDPAAETTAGQTGPEAPTGPGGKKGTDWWGEMKAIFWLILAMLAFHSFIAKPFYIPSESMMPTLVKGDRLVVTKYPYGWSWVSPSFHLFPPTRGRLLGSLPERGDIVIATPPGQRADYIKRVIGLPGDVLEMIDGELIINGEPVRREERPPAMLPVDANLPCPPDGNRTYRVEGEDGQLYCRLPIFREYLPNGRYYDTIDVGYTAVDDFAPIRIPEGHVFLMGDNRDHSADSRVPIEAQGLGAIGKAPLRENLAAAMILTVGPRLRRLL